METNIVKTIERQDWLEPVENTLQTALNGAFEAGGETGQKVEDFLHGTWLGHPLHSALTDVPIGAWTAAVAFDVAGYDAAADAAIGVGLVGAVGSAVTGLTDWKNISDGDSRRVGLIH